MRALVWFRADLRTADHHALYHACTEADQGVVGVFTVVPAQWQEHDWGNAKVDFLLRNVAALSRELEQKNIALRLVTVPRFADVPAALLQLAQDARCDALFFSHEYEVNEQRRDDAVTALFREHGLRVQTYHDQTILPPHMLRTSAGDHYKVFTPYKRAWLGHVREHGPGECLPAPRKQEQMTGRPDRVPEAVDSYDREQGLPDLWPAGARVAQQRLERFAQEKIRDYKAQRDVPSVDGTSRISAYLTHGVISARQCLRAAVEANRGKLADGRVGPDAWLSELIWREFYRHVLVGFPRVSRHRPFRPDTADLPWRDDEADFAAWCAGRTGFPIVDAGMRQLRQEGWMHNRLRMITAMFLTKNLLIDWRRGERHFMRHLVDGDLASNNGGWQWSASTGTDAAPYFRIFNPLSQSKRFDAEGRYIRRYVPELDDVDAAALHDDRKLTEAQRNERNYPLPICDLKASRQRALDVFKQATS